MSRFCKSLLIASNISLAACGGGSEAAPIECGSDLATDEELALTPRADSNLEQLAIVATKRVVAGQTEYDRVVRDVAAIREARPDLAEVGFFSAIGQGLIVRADEATIVEMQAGRYQGWACLNDRFRVKDMVFGTSVMRIPDRVRFAFDGIYHIPLLIERYERLPNVESAAADIRIGDGSTICVTPGEPQWHYVVDQGSRDCESGCIDHDYDYFVTTRDGTVTPSGSWATRSGNPTPSWFTQYVTDEACHGLGDSVGAVGWDKLPPKATGI